MKDAQQAGGSRNRSSFTLIEMLVVIVIIGILIGLIIPAVSRAKEKARSARCCANLRQLQIAAMSYATDNGSFPSAVSSEGQEWFYVGRDLHYRWVKTGTGWVDWSTQAEPHDPDGHSGDKRTYWYGPEAKSCITNGTLYPYTRDVRIYLCPTFSAKGWTWDGQAAYRSYGMNSDASGSGLSSLGEDGSRRLLFADLGAFCDKTREDDTAGASLTIEQSLVENNELHDPCPPGRGIFFRGCDAMIEGTTNGSGGLVEAIGAYHDGLANCIFKDGHIQRISWTNTQAICQGEWGGIR